MRARTHLGDAENGVGRDDRSGREVDSLPHQIPSHAALLALDPLPQRLERPPTALLRGWNPGNLIVDQRRTMVLQQILNAPLYVLRLPILDRLGELEVGLSRRRRRRARAYLCVSNV